MIRYVINVIIPMLVMYMAKTKNPKLPLTKCTICTIFWYFSRKYSTLNVVPSLPNFSTVPMSSKLKRSSMWDNVKHMSAKNPVGNIQVGVIKTVPNNQKFTKNVTTVGDMQPSTGTNRNVPMPVMSPYDITVTPVQKGTIGKTTRP